MPDVQQQWFTAAELAAARLPGLPADRRSIQRLAARENWNRPDWCGGRWRERNGRGGGVEYHISVLPAHAMAALRRRKPDPPDVKLELTREGAWAAWDRSSAKKKGKAQLKIEAVRDVQSLIQGGEGKLRAVAAVAQVSGVPEKTLYRWFGEVRAVASADQAALLVPRHAGRAPSFEVSAEAWDSLTADYLRPSQPNFSDCYRRLVAKNDVDAMGWVVPSERTLLRKMRGLSPAMVTLFRQGEDAVLRMFPAQKRDRTMLHALQAVNADGHKWDVFVRWPDGSVARPMMVAFQDLYSNMILAWRVDKTENKEATRLAFGDVVESYGIPHHCYFDNGRGFTSKWITGRTPNRFRFKVKDEDPEGLLTALGVTIHWTRPYSGQSKPIERAFRDLAQGLAKHPRFEGAYTGNRPDAKPENYGSRAVDLDVFLRTVAEGIAEHNQRLGRRTDVCRQDGLSFAQAFAASYERAPITKATEQQKRLWLMAGEAVRVNRRDGAIEIEGNRYWDPIMNSVLGQMVTVRFDPERLHAPLHVYRMDGVYLCRAECIAAAGFADVSAAREQAQRRKTWLRGLRMQRDAEGKMTLDQLVAALPASDEPEPLPQAKLVKPVFGNTALKPAADLEEEPEGERLLMQFARRRRAQLRAVDGGDD